MQKLLPLSLLMLTGPILFGLVAGDPNRDPQTPLLQIGNLVAGQTAQVSIQNASPFGVVWVAYSLKGDGPTSILGQIAFLTPPISLLPPLTADANGGALLFRAVPAESTGVHVWFHGIDIQTLQPTNALGLVVG